MSMFDNQKKDWKQILEKFYDLEIPSNFIQITYVWIDGSGQTMRAKDRIITTEPKSYKELPIWNFDGSSTGQADGHNSDVYLHPIALFKDPFRGNPHKIVLCETYDYDGKPTKSNARIDCEKTMERVKDAAPWFGIEQEYTLFGADRRPLGWPTDGVLPPQGPYYCGIGPKKIFGRDILEAHYRACLFAGVKIGGTNIEVMPSQFEYQIGPCEGIKMGDELWMSRYLLERVAEEFGVQISFDPKPLPEWNGAGAHCNFSTKETREEGGIKVIRTMIDRLEKRHAEHVRVYDANDGRDNKRRLTGAYETSSIEVFSSGVADRGASIRIPRQVLKDGKGYLEDRRPAANADPYKVTSRICKTCILDE